MKVLVYAPVTERAAQLFQRVIEAIEAQAVEGAVEICRTIDSLTCRLRQPTYDVAVAVLLATTKEDLLAMLSIRDLIWNVHMILILPDRESDTIAQGHTLRPRFLTYADSDASDVVAVLTRMLGNTHPDEKGEQEKTR